MKVSARDVSVDIDVDEDAGDTPLLVQRILALQQAVEKLMAEHGPGVQEALREEVPGSDSRMALTVLTGPLVMTIWAIVKATFPETPLEMRAQVVSTLFEHNVETAAINDETFDFTNMKARLN